MAGEETPMRGCLISALFGVVMTGITLGMLLALVALAILLS